MKNFLAAGFVIIFLLSACSGLMTAGEESPQPLFTSSPVTDNLSPESTEGTPEITETTIPATDDLDKFCSEDSGIIETYEIPWNDEILTGRIYLPPCYGSDLDREYPTLYMLHGATETTKTACYGPYLET